jgi:hypothetical protein
VEDVFISYSRDNDSHNENVRTLVEQLRVDGISVAFDGDHHPDPKGSWNKWSEKQASEATSILVVMTENYRKSWMRDHPEGKMSGSTLEAYCISERISAGSLSDQNFCRVVIFDKSEKAHIPPLLSGSWCFLLSADYHILLSWLRRESSVTPKQRPRDASSRNLTFTVVGESAGSRINLFIRWALNRMPGVLFVECNDQQSLSDGFCSTERLLLGADQGRPRLRAREWVVLAGVPLTKTTAPTLIKELSDCGATCRGQLDSIRNDGKSLGLLLNLSNAGLDGGEMNTLRRWLLAVQHDAPELAPLVVVTMRPGMLNRSSILLDNCSTTIPGELLRIVPNFVAEDHSPSGSGIQAFACAPVRGLALANWYAAFVSIEANKEVEALHSLITKLLSVAFERTDWQPAMWVVADFEAAIELESPARVVSALKQFLGLMMIRGASFVRGFIRACSGSVRTELRKTALSWCVAEPELVEAWCEGVPVQERAALFSSGLLADRAGNGRALIEAVVFAAVRCERSGRPFVDASILEHGLALLEPGVRRGVEVARAERKGSDSDLWHHASPTMLRAFAAAAPDADLPDSLFSSEHVALWEQPEFWFLVETRPLTASLVAALLRLPADARATLGLCSSEEWIDLARRGRLGFRVAELRRHSS